MRSVQIINEYKKLLKSSTRKRGEESGKRIANEQTGHGHSANRADYSVETRKTA